MEEGKEGGIVREGERKGGMIESCRSMIDRSLNSYCGVPGPWYCQIRNASQVIFSLSQLGVPEL